MEPTTDFERRPISCSVKRKHIRACKSHDRGRGRRDSPEQSSGPSTCVYACSFRGFGESSQRRLGRLCAADSWCSPCLEFAVERVLGFENRKNAFPVAQCFTRWLVARGLDRAKFTHMVEPERSVRSAHENRRRVIIFFGEWRSLGRVERAFLGCLGFEDSSSESKF